MAIDQTIQASPSGLPAASPTVSASTQQPASVATAQHHAGFFRTLLSDLNPLQYIPVVGPIYRAITGDEGNADLRFVASLGTSFALGGPIGVGITVAEKVTGFDPEAIGRHLLARLFHPGAKPAATAPVPSSTSPSSAHPATGDAGAALASDPTAPRAWTTGELTAYGVTRTADNTLVAGGLSSADVLNTLELHRLSTTRYA